MRRTFTAAGLILATGMALSACQRSEPRAGVMESPSMIGAARPHIPRAKSELVTTANGPADGYAHAVLIARQRLAAADAGPERMGADTLDTGPRETRPVRIAFRDLDAKDALSVIIGEFLGRPFLIDPSVTGGVTLDVEADLSNRDLYDLLDAVCIVHNWSVEARGQTLLIRPGNQRLGTSAAPVLAGRAAAPSERPAVRVFPMRYITAQQAGDTVKTLLSAGATTVVSGRLLVVADTIAQLNRFGDVISTLDRPAFAGVELWTYELAHQRPDDAVRVLGALASQAGLGGASAPLATFLAIPRSSRVMVIARDVSLQEMIGEWVSIVDQPPDHPRRLDYVYRIQHLDPASLKAMLDQFYVGRLEADARDPNDPGMRVVVVPDEDLLLIRATPGDYADLIALMERVDRARQQVHLHGVVAEVTLSDSLRYGVEYFLSTETGSGLLDLTGSVNQFSPANPAGSAVFLATSGFAVIDALRTMSNVAVLSTPNITVRDRAEANLTVGADVPIVTASQDSPTQVGGTSGIRNEVEYRPTGVILGVTPRINESGDVTLVIKLEVTDAVPTTSSGIDSPTFTTRIAETTVTVPHGQTVLIGGAIESRRTDRNSRIPILGDIPAIGEAFKSREKEISRTELLLAITPTIVNEPADNTYIISDFLESAAGLRSALARFQAPLPDALRLSEARALERAIAEAASVETQEAPAPDPDDRSLARLAAMIPAPARSEEAAAVALFLADLARRAPIAPGGG